MSGLLCLAGIVLIRISYDDVVKNCEVTYVAGGAAQNAARAAAVSLKHHRDAPCSYLVVLVRPTTQIRRLHWLGRG